MMKKSTNSDSLCTYVLENQLHSLKLHLGCGGERLKGYLNIDLYPFDENISDTSRSGCVADIFADIRDLGLESNSVEEIVTSHVVEHFYRWEAIDMLTDWYRILKPGGILITEMPDFIKCVFWLFHYKKEKRRLAKSQFYGNQWDRLEYETHKYVWSGREFKDLLLKIGFKKVTLTHKTKTHVRGRDMRVVAIK